MIPQQSYPTEGPHPQHNTMQTTDAQQGESPSSLHYNHNSVGKAVGGQPTHDWSQTTTIAQQQHGNNTLFYQQEEKDYDQYLQQHNHWQHPNSLQQPQERSIAIPILRTTGGQTNTIDPPSDEDEDSSGIIDVELDAIKLRQRYGDQHSSNCVVQSYQERASNQMLKAPYLGSLNHHDDYLSLPPIMSLSEPLDTNTNTNTNANNEPPNEIGGTSYGSLRDSHQRGRFLDGPSSYREPSSGQIRRLDHRVRYHGAPSSSLSSSQPTTSSRMSIGERMQRSIQLKEIRKKEQEEENQESVKQGGLSAMMNQLEIKKPVHDGTSSLLEEERFVLPPAAAYEIPTFRDADDSPTSNNMMMSTSLTAFELLMTTNLSLNENKTTTTKNNNPYGGESSAVSISGEETAMDQQQQHFKTLSRTMSDPTALYQSLGRRMDNLQQFQNANAQPHSSNKNNNIWAPPTMNALSPVNEPMNAGMDSNHHHHHHHHPGYNNPVVTEDVNAFHHYAAASSVDHYPDIDGAFGDMDME